MNSLKQQQTTQLINVLSDRERVLREEIRREMNLQDNYVQLASEVPDPGDLSFANLSIDLGNAAVTRDINELRAIELARKKWIWAPTVPVSPAAMTFLLNDCRPYPPLSVARLASRILSAHTIIMG